MCYLQDTRKYRHRYTYILCNYSSNNQIKFRAQCVFNTNENKFTYKLFKCNRVIHQIISTSTRIRHSKSKLKINIIKLFIKLSRHALKPGTVQAKLDAQQSTNKSVNSELNVHFLHTQTKTHMQLNVIK